VDVPKFGGGFRFISAGKLRLADILKMLEKMPHIKFSPPPSSLSEKEFLDADYADFLMF